ncbi:MAG: hypothetical protein COU46_03580 [Candidatus Niyogibacteria bacterium CG10_big_fil_rev_8_21_14_0_10_42_19]|uniref:Prepilin-type N-terminal cleavage/methylation domain-containing protein n=1 Tax=Candidatus Niyogibacteria bacterium CG10_big_fil_rev_8_21_14_0_10_42_19 TaxID=1974725 RepID=A0A2H0TES2_9BACT|nr:MAG: hypothetical protein COU46_03580 [Candidatus Niyogibacteria bacterium CG10_big_fil_rev_8_21_14_0_10_42_19]
MTGERNKKIQVSFGNLMRPAPLEVFNKTRQFIGKSRRRVCFRAFFNSRGASGHQKGFTLIETIVAITILLFGIMGSLSLATLGVRGVTQTRSNITVAFLAEEGLEYMRGKRDEGVMRGAGWLNFINICSDPNGCYVDVPNDAIIVCGASGCPKLLFNEANGLFNHNFGSQTQFTRKIKINTINANEIEIESEISWPGRLGIVQSVSIKSHLFDWQI